MASNTIIQRRSKASSKRSYKVLGTEEEEPLQQQQQHDLIASAPQAEEQQPPPTVGTCSQQDFPADVWAAACLSADKGAAVLQACLDVRSLRESYRCQLASLEFTQGLGKDGFNSRSVFHTGKQLWSPPNHKKATLPPLTAHLTAPDGSHEACDAGMLQPSSGTTRARRNMHYSRVVNATQEHRKLDLYEEQQQVWSGVEATLAAKTRRPVHDLAMARGPEHRAHQEVLEALQRAIPLQERAGGPDAWNMSLRNAWERVVPLGSLFSGLTATIRETPPSRDATGKPTQLKPHEQAAQQRAHDRLMRVGRPLEPLPPTALPRAPALSSCHHRVEGRSLALRGRNWACSDVLKSRLDTYADALNRQFPFKPDMPSLLITGQSLADMLLSSLDHDVTLQDVISYLSATSPAAAQQLQQLVPNLQLNSTPTSFKHFLQQAAHVDPAAAKQLHACLPHASNLTLQQALDVLEETNPAAAQQLRVLQVQLGLTNSADSTSQHPHDDMAGQPQADDAGMDGCRQGIHVHCDQSRLVLHCSTGQQYTTSLQLSNNGSVVLTYEWRRSTPAPHPLSHAAQQTGSGQLPPSFQVLQAHGVLLPGETHTATVMFKPITAGVQKEEWELCTVPSLPVDHPAVRVKVVGCAVKPPSGAPARQQLNKQLDQEEKMCKVWAAVNRILADVTPCLPYPSGTETEAMREAAAAWDAANADVWPPLYWPGQEVQAHFEQLYSTARAALLEACKPPPLPADTKKGATGAGKKPAKGAPAAAEPAVPVITWPETWSVKVADISGLLDELSAPMPVSESPQGQAAETAVEPTQAAVAASAVAADLRSQLTALLASQAVRVPADSRTLMRHAARAALCRVVDAVEGKLAAVHADYAQRVADASSKAGATGAPPNASAWLADKTKTGARAHMKTLVPNWWEDIAKEKAAIAEWMTSALSQLDQQQGKHLPRQTSAHSAQNSSQAVSTHPSQADVSSQADVTAHNVPEAMHVENSCVEVTQPSIIASVASVAPSQLPAEASQAQPTTPSEELPLMDAALPEPTMAEEDYYWRKFELLREWARLGLPGSQQHPVESRVTPANSGSSTTSC